MPKTVLCSIFIQYFLPIWVNHLSVDANPQLIGDEVSPAKPDEFPSVVSLAEAPGRDLESHFCTGTLITKKHVLTAAHCLKRSGNTKLFMKPSEIVVTVGSLDFTQDTKYSVKEFKTFDRWTTERNITIPFVPPVNFYHDVAVVTLTKDIVEDIKPAHVSNLKLKQVYGKNVVTAGWGITNHGLRPRFLQRADLRVVDRRTCLRNLKATGWSTYDVLNQLCTVGRSSSISLGCGDSGGPIFINGDEVVGVNDGICGDLNHPNHQDLHVSVKFYRKFIVQMIGTHCRVMANEEYNLNDVFGE